MGRWPSAGGGRVVVPGAGEPYPTALVVEVTEAVGGARGGVHGPVCGLGTGVGDPGLQEGEDLRLPGVRGGGEPVELGDPGPGTPAVEPVQAVRDVGALPAGPGGGRQRPKFLLGDPRGQNLPGRVTVDEVVPHLQELIVGQLLAGAQQPSSGRPRRVGLASAAPTGVPGDPAPDVSERLAGQADEMEVVRRPIHALGSAAGTAAR